MAATVSVFNASQQTIAVSVNQGPQFTVPGTGPAQNWAPQAQAYGAGPSYSPGYPALNQLGSDAPNTIVFYVGGYPVGGGPVTFSLPARYPIMSVQIYVFFSAGQGGTLAVLTDGQLCAQQVLGGVTGEAPPE
jgi:hypothetical protein